MNDDERFRRLAEVLEQAKDLFPEPEPKKPVIEPPTETCICGKTVLASPDVLHALNTGVFTTLNDVCKGCAEGEKLDRENARLVCSRCKRVMLRMEPHVDPHTKFEFKAGKSYHLESCALCDPAPNGEGKEYKIIEVLLWKNKHNIK